MAGLTGLAPLSGSFPADAVAGMTGAGALESRGTALPPQKLGIVAKNRNIVPGFSEGQIPSPYEFDDGYGEYILPGSVNPDRTPRSHSAPFAGWAGDYNNTDGSLSDLNQNMTQVHSEDFGALNRRVFSAKASTAEPEIDIWYDNSAGESNLEPLNGQIRAMAGYDATQGYGGGGSGPGGINEGSQGHGKRTVMTNAQPTYSLDPAERPFIVPQGGMNFHPNDAVQGPMADNYGWSYGDGASPYRDPSAYSPPPEPTNFSGSYTEGPIV